MSSKDSQKAINAEKLFAPRLSDPTPWWSDRGNDGTWLICSDDVLVASTNDDFLSHPSHEANAAFIVRACNSHDDLVAALMEAADVLAELGHDSDALKARQAIKRVSWS